MKYRITQKDIDNKLSFLRPGAKAGDVEELSENTLLQHGLLKEEPKSKKK